MYLERRLFNQVINVSILPGPPTPNSATLIITVIGVIGGLVVVGTVISVVVCVTSRAGSAPAAAPTGVGTYLVSAARPTGTLPTLQVSAADTRFAFLFPGRRPRNSWNGPRVFRDDRW